MDVTLSEDQQMLQDMTRRFLEDRSPIGALRKLVDGDGTLDRTVWREAAELGWVALFVPEANYAGDGRAVANAMLVFGRHRGFGFSPFSIDGLQGPGAERLAGLYDMLANMTPAIVAAQREGRIMGFGAPVNFDGKVDESVQKTELGGARFTVTFIDPWTARDKQQPSEHGGLLIWLGGEDYLVAGNGVTFTVAPVDGKGRFGLDQRDGLFPRAPDRLRRLGGRRRHGLVLRRSAALLHADREQRELP